MQFFLKQENKPHWEQVQSLAAADHDDELRAYVLEALRLTSTQRNLRIATQQATIDGKTVKPGDAVVLFLGAASRDAKAVPDADKFLPHRSQKGFVTAFSTGPHDCVGRELATNFIVGLVKLSAGLKDLRPAPSQAGTVKKIQVGTEMCYLNDSWSHLSFDASSTCCPVSQLLFVPNLVREPRLLICASQLGSCTLAATARVRSRRRRRTRAIISGSGRLKLSCGRGRRSGRWRIEWVDSERRWLLIWAWGLG